MKEMKVKNAIITKQIEDSDNFQEFLKTTNEENVNIILVEAGDKIQIENNLYFDVLWPNSKYYISENPLNNNSLVCKLIYKDFSMLFTGDIEEIAEKEILKIYKDRLKANILKVAHHGSKTSTTKEFVEAVSPQIALIGVGENNKFGHPDEIILRRLNDIGCKIYRTDENGEIVIKRGRLKGDGPVLKGTVLFGAFLCIKLTKKVNNKTKEKRRW